MPFSIRSGLFVFVLLSLAMPAHAGDVADEIHYSGAAHNARAGLAEAASIVAQQTEPRDETNAVDAGKAASGVLSAALAVAAQGVGSSSSVNAEQARDLRCLAEGIYFEARGEPWRGQLAVGRVILNRVASKQYPDTVCDVVYQNSHLHNRCQFSFACDGKDDSIRNADAWFSVRGFASWLLANNETKPSGSEYQLLAALESATHYHADYVLPHWAEHFELTARIGRHIFYSDPSV